MQKMNKLYWNPWFAWRPVKTIEGKWAWLKPVECACFDIEAKIAINLMLPELGSRTYTSRRRVYRHIKN